MGRGGHRKLRSRGSSSSLEPQGTRPTAQRVEDPEEGEEVPVAPDQQGVDTPIAATCPPLPPGAGVSGCWLDPGGRLVLTWMTSSRLPRTHTGGSRGGLPPPPAPEKSVPQPCGRLPGWAPSDANQTLNAFARGLQEPGGSAQGTLRLTGLSR